MPVNIISLPAHNNKYEYEIASEKPVAFKDTDLKERNVKINKYHTMGRYYTEGDFCNFNEILTEFYLNPNKLDKDKIGKLKEVFLYMEKNNLDIIEQSKILLLNKNPLFEESSSYPELIYSHDIDKDFFDESKEVIKKNIDIIVGREMKLENIF